MEIAKLSRIEKDLTEEELQAAENIVGKEFPDQYREFLLKYNGGHPAPDIFRYKNEDGDQELAAIAYFLAVYDGKDENLLDYFETYEDRIPSQLIPIARGPGGDLVLLGLESSYRGKIYYWIQDLEPDEPDFSNIFPVAGSFNEFLDSLFDPTQ